MTKRQNTSMMALSTPKNTNLDQNGPRNGPEGSRPIGPSSGYGPNQRAEEVKVEMSGRERLKKHRVEMAGRVWIPDVWGQEKLLKDWADCSGFDTTRNSSLVSARAALVAEGRMRTNSTGLRIENSC